MNLKKDNEYVKKENKMIINIERKKTDIKLLKNKNEDLKYYLNKEKINYDKELTQEKRKKEKSIKRIKRKQSNIYCRKKISRGKLAFIKDKNEAEKKIMEAYKKILAKKDKLLNQLERRYGSYLDKMQTINGRMTTDKNKSKRNKESSKSIINML